MSDNLPRFKANDFFFLETDAGVIREDIRQALADYLGYVPTDADPYMVTCSALMPYIVQSRALADSAAKATLLTYSQGMNLDRIADNSCAVGYLNRLSPQSAMLCVRLNITSLLPSYDPEHTTVLYHVECNITHNELTYSGAYDGSIEIDGETQDYYLYFSFPCETAGSVGNQYDFRTPAYTDIIERGITLTLDGETVDLTGLIASYGAYGGKDEETDDEFANRIAIQMQALRIPGGVAYYENVINDTPYLKNYYVSPETFFSSDQTLSQYNGCIQIFYNGEHNPELTYSPEAKENNNDLESVLREKLKQNKLISDSIVLEPARTKDIIPVVYVHYSLFVGDDDLVSVIQQKWKEILEKYTYKIGILINFDDISATLVQAGAADSVCMQNQTVVENIKLYENEYITSFALHLYRDADKPRTEGTYNFAPDSDIIK